MKKPAPETVSPPIVSLEEGDRLFSAGRYAEAGQCYAALALQNRLPAHRKEHWAYCRMVAIGAESIFGRGRPKNGTRSHRRLPTFSG